MLDESLASSPTVRFGAYRSRESREKPCSWLGCSSLASPRCILVGYNVLETSRLRASTLRGGRHSVSSSLVKEAHRDKAGRTKVASAPVKRIQISGVSKRTYYPRIAFRLFDRVSYLVRIKLTHGTA